MTQENLAIVLNRANCCIAEKALQLSKLWSIGSKCYKEELRNLKILNDSVDALLNNAFTQGSIFQSILTNSQYTFVNTTVLNSTLYLYINEVEYTIEPDGVITILNAITSKLTELGITYSVTGSVNETYLFTVEADCSITSIRTSYNYLISTPGSETVAIFFATPALDGTYILYNNGAILATYVATSTTLLNVYTTLLTSVGLTYSQTAVEGVFTVTVETSCEINNLSIVGPIESGSPDTYLFEIKELPVCDEILIASTFNNVQSGICQGCLTEEQINTLTERVMSICSICNCELDNL
jgi:formylmethanofuran dehydrogenase subunit E-like metal-binding protein